MGTGGPHLSSPPIPALLSGHSHDRPERSSWAESVCDLLWGRKSHPLPRVSHPQPQPGPCTHLEGLASLWGPGSAGGWRPLLLQGPGILLN